MTSDDLLADDPPEQRGPVTDPQLGWTPAELDPLSPDSLRLVLTRDLRTKPTGTTRTALLVQIQFEQENHIARGDLHWKSWNVEDVLLYNPTAARQGTAIVNTLEAVSDWADLGRLVATGDSAADYALPYLWDLWESDDYEALGLDEDYEVDREISRVVHLLGAIPSWSPLDLGNRNEDSEFRFVDPFNPWQMGVPRLIIKRYCDERSNLVSDWSAAAAEDLPLIGSTAQALGWSFSEGQESDLGSLL